MISHAIARSSLTLAIWRPWLRRIRLVPEKMRGAGFNLNTVAIIVGFLVTTAGGLASVVKITHAITHAQDAVSARLDRQDSSLKDLKEAARDDRTAAKGVTDDLKRQFELLRYEMGEVKLALAQAGIYFSDQGNHVTVRRRR